MEKTYPSKVDGLLALNHLEAEEPAVEGLNINLACSCPASIDCT